MKHAEHAIGSSSAYIFCALVTFLSLTPGAAYSETSATSQLFLAVGKGAASEVGGAAAGWALGAMGLSDGSDDVATQLAQIYSELIEIEDTLEMMSTELVDIKDAIQQLDCDSLSSNTSAARALIDSLSQDYNTFVQTASGSGPLNNPPAVPPISCPVSQTSPGDCLENWVNAVLDDSSTTTGILNALNQINQALINVGSSQGIIAACLAPGVLPSPTAGTFDDSPYYEQVANLLNYYYNYQTRGLLLLVEAYHFRAWQDLGQPGGDFSTDPSASSEICTQATDGAVITACTNAVNDTNTIYNNLLNQFETAGAPYSDSNVLLHYVTDAGAEDAAANLYVRSLEDFTAAAGDSCPSPLTSVNQPCGVTVGYGLKSFRVNYSDQDNWVVARSTQLQTLLDGQGSSQTPAEYLNSVGFENMADKIVLTPDLVYFTIGQSGSSVGYNAAAWCFIDTDISNSFSKQPFCSSSAVFDKLLQVTGNKSLACRGYPQKVPIYGKNSHLPTNRNGFYDVTFTPGGGGGNNTDYCRYFPPNPQPGWMMLNLGNNPQYRWPAIAVDKVTCTNGRSLTNPGGAFTRCRDNFDAWFARIVSALPTASGISILNQPIPEDMQQSAKFNMRTGELIVPCVKVEGSESEYDVKFFDVRLRQIGSSLKFISGKEQNSEVCIE